MNEMDECTKESQNDSDQCTYACDKTTVDYPSLKCMRVARIILADLSV